LLVIGIIFSLIPDTVHAPPSDYTYVEYNGVAMITGYTGAGDAITIPSTLGGLITGIIGNNAFNSSNGHLITSIIIPNSVTEIWDNAFYGCTLLQSITIGSDVTKIKYNVLKYCSNLISINLMMINPPYVCDCWVDNTPSSLRGHALTNSNFPPPGGFWVEGNLTMGEYLNLPPTADFTYSPSAPTKGVVIQFTDTSTDSDGSVVSWSWDFDDGGTSTLKNPTHNYADDGIYTVILTVTDDDGASDSISKDLDMSNEHPIAYFTYSPSSPTDLDVIQFIDESLDRDGTVVSRSWNFGDEGSSTLQNPIHDYADDGIYTVILTVTDDDGASDLVSNDIVVSNVPPTADFTYSPSEPTDLDVIQFTDTSIDTDGMIVSWSCNFGDGASSTTKNPTHRFSASGTYTITLEVTDDDGIKKSISKTIIINQSEPPNNQPVANFSFSPSIATADDTIQFTDTSVDSDGTITSYLWNFGDGTSSTSKNPNHRYTTNGVYSITLEITDNDGATDLFSKEILVEESQNKDTTGTVTNKGTPGFELVFVIGAIAVALFLWRKNRNI